MGWRTKDTANCAQDRSKSCWIIAIDAGAFGQRKDQSLYFMSQVGGRQAVVFWNLAQITMAYPHANVT